MADPSRVSTDYLRMWAVEIATDAAHLPHGRERAELEIRVSVLRETADELDESRPVVEFVEDNGGVSDIESALFGDEEEDDDDA